MEENSFVTELTGKIKNLFSLEDRVSVITGGASGFGEAIAIGFAYYGSDIALLDMNEAGLERVAEEVRSLGRRCITVKVDVTDFDSLSAAAERVKAELGVPHVLVNSAGMNIRKPFLEMLPEDFRKVLDIDLTGTFLATKAFGAMMVEAGRGSVINLSSVNAISAVAKNGAYGASKAGVAQITRVFALEWAETGVRVNALCPAFHKTPLVKQIMSDEAWYGHLISRTPMGRFGEVYEIIGPALYLASDASSYTTGASIYDDGGWTAI